jgi:hypothetical protein
MAEASIGIIFIPFPSIPRMAGIPSGLDASGGFFGFAMLSLAPFVGTLCLLLCYRRYLPHRTAQAFTMYYVFPSMRLTHTLSSLVLPKRT